MLHLRLPCLLLMCACGSSGGGDAPARGQVAQELQASLEAENISDPVQLPSSGAAKYAGFMNARLPVGDGGAITNYLGDLAMTVNFKATAGQVTGRADGFTAKSGNTLSGHLKIGGSNIYRQTDTDVNYTFAGTVDGTLTKAADAYVIDAEINGEFRGRHEDGVTGVLFGDITGPLGQDIFDGDFFAERTN